MFKGAYQKKLLTVLYSGGSNPLEIWDIQVKNGWTRRVKDEDMGSIVFEVCGTNVATAYIVTPPDPRGVLGVSLPFITMLIKNLKRYFTFEIQILDDKNMRRRFRFSNYQSTTKVRPFTCNVPLALKPGWNQMQLNLANFTMRAYGTNYMETQRVQIHANCRIRRIYFSDRLYTEEELPRDYRIYLNVRQAPRPPAPEPEEQPPLRAGPSSILKVPSKSGDGGTVELEVTKTSLKSSGSLEHKSLQESVTEVTQLEPSKSMQSIHWSSSVDAELTAKKSGSQVSRRSLVLPEEQTALLEIPEEELQEGEPAAVAQVDEQVPAEEGEQREVQEVVEPQEAAVEAMVEAVPEAMLAVETEESTAAESPRVETSEADSPRTEPATESEYAESEPLPESDVEPEAPDSPAN